MLRSEACFYDVIGYADLEVHHTIAELMILANVEVAKFIYKAYPTQVALCAVGHSSCFVAR